MKYVLFIKDDIAMAKAVTNKPECIKTDIYDRCEEITGEEYQTIKLPAVKKDGFWTKTDNHAKIICYESETEDPQPTEIDRLRADVDYIAIMTGVTL